MKKKRIICLPAAFLLLTALLSGCGKAEGELPEPQGTGPQTQAATISTWQKTQTVISAFPVDVRFTEYAVLEIPQEELQLTDPETKDTLDGTATEDGSTELSETTGATEGLAEEKPKDTYLVFRSTEADQDGNPTLHRIQVQRQTETGLTVFTGILDDNGLVWDEQEDSLLILAKDRLKDALSEAQQWEPCAVTQTYAVNRQLSQCMASERNVFYTDSAYTVFQVQTYDETGALTSVAALSPEEMLLMTEDAVSQLQWNDDLYPELCLDKWEELTIPIPTEASETQEISQYEEQIRELTQQNKRSRTIMIVLAVLTALLVVSNLFTLVQASRRNSRASGKARRKPPQSGGSTVSGFGTVHNIGSRSGQQDSFDVINCPAGTLAVVADGMGGLADGDKVSQKIIATMRADSARIQPGNTDGILCQMVAHVNQEVNRMLGAARQYKCGSTLLAVLVEQGTMQWATVGDSRIYLYRGGSLLQINREHVYKAELTERAISGKLSFSEAARDPQAERLSSFIGMGDLKHVDFCLNKVKLLKGDRILLMSDGVFNTLRNEEIARLIQNAPNASEAARQIEQRVLQKQVPNQDNFTCVILEI